MEDIEEATEDRVILMFSLLLSVLAVGFLIAIAQAELHPMFTI